MNDLEPQWLWLIAGALLGIAELIVPGVFLIWIAAAAAATGLVVLATGIALPFQFALFALFSIGSVYAGRRWYANNPVPSSDPLLNDRAARLVGRNVTVVSAIRGGEGRVKVGDSVWSCRGEDCDEGARVRVTGAEGNCLLVQSEPARLIEGRE
ncbi:MAG: NfeD family protein [Alphaproteobacteria bacterium]|nr:NfeD family protein [Alphaproteobacteria bacterium]MBV9372448.1 NfeD family protein [Alphaproteobacteria bacterium]MBV9902123.1 NfeD family protein [Alphaproteobacteria bacterium]